MHIGIIPSLKPTNHFVTIRHTGIIQNMIFGPDYTKEIRLRLTLSMKAGLAAIVIGATKTFFERKDNSFPINLNEGVNYLGGFSTVYGLIKIASGFAPLPKEPEEYMLTDAIRFRKEGIAELLLGLTSLVINNKDFISSLIK